MHKPEKLKKEFNKVEEENWTFRAFLKGTEPDDMDKFVNELHETLFKEVDCMTCQNCCKSIVPALSNKDIARLSKKLGMTFDGFKDKYLVKNARKSLKNIREKCFLTE